jgi:GNAT superfamily N-acetyltransferase
MAERLEGMDRIALRRMSARDIPLGMKLKSCAGWNQLEEDWRMFLGAGGDSFVAALDGIDVGTVVSIPYQDHFTWIAMVLVDPAARRKGIGTALLEKAIEHSLVNGPVRLDATPDGYELYMTMGFKAEYELVRMARHAGKHTPEPGRCCEAVREADLQGIIDYDAPVFGADREYIIRTLFKRNPEYACIIRDNDTVRGYCLGRSGSSYELLGPLVAETSAEAEKLLLTALQECSTKDVVIDALTDKPEWIDFLEAAGFTRQRPFTRMCLGDLNHPGIRRKQFAIGGPETG